MQGEKNWWKALGLLGVKFHHWKQGNFRVSKWERRIDECINPNFNNSLPSAENNSIVVIYPHFSTHVMNQIPLYCNIHIQGVQLPHYKLQPVMFFQFSCASFSNHPKKDLARAWVFRPCYNTWHNTEETDQEWWFSGFTIIPHITLKKQIKSRLKCPCFEHTDKVNNSIRT